MSTVLVTGGTGCLGMALVRQLSCGGANVRVLVRHTNHIRKSGLPPGVTFFEGDITVPDTLSSAVEGVDVVYHLAAKVHIQPRSPEQEKEFFSVNADGTASLLAACRRANVHRFVLYSTVAVYGEVDGLSADESTPVAPRTAYGRSKLAAEEHVLAGDGVEGCVIRLPVAYGPGDRGNVGRLIRAISKRRFLLVKGVQGKRSMVGADNAAAGAVLAGTHPNANGEVFIVTDGSPITLVDIVSAVNLSLNRVWRPPSIPGSAVRCLTQIGSWASDLSGHNLPLTRDSLAKVYGSLEFSSQKIRDCLGYKPVHTFDEGITAEVAWLHEQGII